MTLTFIKNRDGEIINFDINRIQNAIIKAYNATGQSDKSEIDSIVNSIKIDLEKKSTLNNKDNLINIEEIQDIVEQNLIKFNKYEIAKAYILYRQKHNENREKQKQSNIKKIEKNKFMVTKNDGTKENFDIDKLKNSYERICFELREVCPFEDLEKNIKKYIIEGIKTSELNRLIIKSALDLVSLENIKRQSIAARFSILNLYKKASRNRNIEIEETYSPISYYSLFDEYVKKGLYYSKFYDSYSKEDILKAGTYLNKTRDFSYIYTTVFMLEKRYLLNPNKYIMELPQEMYMSIALFLAIPEKKEERFNTAMKIYDYISDQKISLPTPTLLNARTNFHQLSSCFKMSIDDDLRAIYHSIENMAQISKFGGGIGTYLGHIRSKGGSIRGIKGASGGVAPWIKVINDTAIAVNQLGARLGSISTTLDIWHKDIFEFLDLQTETGDIRRKSFDIFPAVSIPDIFMKRVENNESWTLFDPKEIKDLYGKRLEDFFGKDFEDFYIELENNTNIGLKEIVNAKELFKKFLKTVVETGMPYVFFRDIANRLNPNKHCGNVYSSQLCTEIIQNMSPTTFVEEVQEGENISIKYKYGDMVVCNLASINVAKINTDEEIEKVIPIAMKILDNVIDLNYYPIKEAEITSNKYRSVGLGFLGVAEYLATNKIMYDSENARKNIDELFEKFAYHTFKASNDIAKQRGAYKMFENSDRAKGIILGKDKQWFEQNSNISQKWSELIDNIKKFGVRFGYHLSPAPNTSTSLVVGTTAGVLPIYKKFFIETNVFASTVNVAPNLNQENFWFYKEYVNMNMNDVIDMVSIIQKWIDQSISFEWIINPMNVSPQEMYSYYFNGWKKGLKTVYYVRSMSLETKECSSCSG